MAKKPTVAAAPEIVDSIESLEAKLAHMREAQGIFATYSQEQVDKIFYEAAMAANKAPHPPGQDGRRGDRPRRARGQGHQEPLCRRVHLQRV